MRMKLDELRQESNQSVSEFVHEMQELFNMVTVGAMPPRNEGRQIVAQPLN